MKVSKALKTALHLEEKKQEFYRECAEETSDLRGRETFLRLAKEKDKRKGEIANILKRMALEEEGEIEKDKVNMFADFNSNLAIKDCDELDAVNIGINTTERTIEIYNEMAEENDSREKQIIYQLKKKEERLASELEEDVNTLTQTGDWWDFRAVSH